MVGYSAREQPLDPISWRRLHDKLQQKSVKIRQLENGKLFSTIETSLHGLPRAQQEQLQLMAVMPSGVAATPEMLANLWDQVGSHGFKHALHGLFVLRIHVVLGVSRVKTVDSVVFHFALVLHVISIAFQEPTYMWSEGVSCEAPSSTSAFVAAGSGVGAR